MRIVAASLNLVVLLLLRARRVGSLASPGRGARPGQNSGDRHYRPLARLLLQRAIQTQLVYLTDFHDELKADWLAQYGEPCAPLGTVRLSNRESRPKYHGLDALTDKHVATYLRSLVKLPAETYAVRYPVGRPDMMPATQHENAELAAAAMSMWGETTNSAAANSRRRNPYLKASQRYIEYNETIYPSRVAQLIAQTRWQLALEWATDLKKLDSITVEDQYEKLTRNAPVDARSTFEDDASSPLRGANLDLCDRLATRHAAIHAVRTLDSTRADALRDALEITADDLALDDDDATQRDADADPSGVSSLMDAAVCRVGKVDALGGHARTRGLALRWLDGLDDPSLAADLRRRRAAVANDWATLVEQRTRDDDADINRQSLEHQMTQVASFDS